MSGTDIFSLTGQLTHDVNSLMARWPVVVVDVVVPEAFFWSVAK
jgi:hypothetical protein